MSLSEVATTATMMMIDDDDRRTTNLETVNRPIVLVILCRGKVGFYKYHSHYEKIFK
jgi:hypothetical protein